MLLFVELHNTQLCTSFYYIILRQKQQPRQNSLYNAAKLLAPRMKHLSEIENSEWLISGDDVKKTMQFRDANDLRVMLFAISRGNPKRAARAISNMLSNDANKIVKEAATKLVFQPNETALTTKLIIEGIREIK